MMMAVRPKTKKFQPVMSADQSALKPEFDAAAADYREQLNQGLKFTGESMEFFAKTRIEWLVKLGVASKSCLDFGCGTGTAAPMLSSVLKPERLAGTDPSGESIAIAREKHGHLAQFATELSPDEKGSFDLAYCNGVFHHIPVAERDGAIDSVFSALRPGGHFALWENNPWNLATRFIMSRVPFDRDAIMLWPRETRARLRRAGFEIVRTDFLFIFPSFLGFLRPLEKFVCRMPFGGQYLVLARKPLK
jgi:SAM-dependent methyltransferase